MKIEEYIKKDVILEGYGDWSKFALDSAFFKELESTHGKIKDVLDITKGKGGILPPFGNGSIYGCIILFESGAVVCAESDGEYVDIFSGKGRLK